MVFAERLKELRKEKGFIQKDLAGILGLSRVAISLYESGNRKPDLVILKKIADYFDVSIDWLLGRTDERKPIKKNDNVEIKELLERYNVMFNSEKLDKPAQESVIEFLQLIKDRDKKIRGD